MIVVPGNTTVPFHCINMTLKIPFFIFQGWSGRIKHGCSEFGWSEEILEPKKLSTSSSEEEEGTEHSEASVSVEEEPWYMGGLKNNSVSPTREFARNFP